MNFLYFMILRHFYRIMLFVIVTAKSLSLFAFLFYMGFFMTFSPQDGLRLSRSENLS